jgi:glycosyltransferase involved in cell wall biosynthesis
MTTPDDEMEAGPVRVLGFGTYDVRNQPRVGIVLEGLRARGALVTELNKPMGFSTAERVAMLAQPWRAYRLVLRLMGRWATLVLGRLRSGRRPDVLVVGYLGHFDVLLARLLYPRRPIVLDLLIFAADTARDRGTTNRLKLRLLAALDHAAVRCSTIVMVDTDEHIALIAPAHRGKAVVVPVGAESAWYDARPADAHPAGPLRVVFFGLYTPLQGAVTIGGAIGLLNERPDIHVTMIGSGQDRDEAQLAARANLNVTWLELVDADELRTLVADHDVCLGIFGTGPKGLRVVPNKIYQGAAAGCAIVTSDSPPQRAAFGDAAVFVAPGDEKALAAALMELADDRDRVDELRADAARLADEAFRPDVVISGLWNRLAR